MKLSRWNDLIHKATLEELEQEREIALAKCFLLKQASESEEDTSIHIPEQNSSTV